MKKRLVFWSVAFLVVESLAFGQKPEGTMAFTVSMESPSNHVYHVVFRCVGLKGAIHDFKMPAWTPGYYTILDYAKNVENFRAEDGRGKPLSWERTTSNTWRVAGGPRASMTVSYDVKATTSFVANSYLDENRAYIMPAGLLMYIAGQIQHPVTLTVVPDPKWNTIATGLDPVSRKKPNTYAASDFDILYDSPILMGNLVTLPSFKIQGVPHRFFAHNPGAFDQEQFMNDLKAVLEAGIAVIGDIPYRHYTFLGIGPGQGGIEHLNSTSFSFRGTGLDTRSGRIRELSFLAHEYFHHYNAKRIRPMALGPFDYDRANLTRMLWVSEGLTSYYEYLMLSRAGMMTLDEILGVFRKHIAAYENNTGHLFQSATQSSYDTWSQGPFGGRGRAGIRKTISYYEKGPVLGLLLDFRIRHQTQNRKSLDTVMRTLYREFYQEKKRGWTDEEFQAVCERVAGGSLAENFDYASTTREIDYGRYLAYAGLELEPPKELPGADFGGVLEDQEGKLMLLAVEEDSPALRAGLAAQDQIKALDGTPVDTKAMNEAFASRKPGDKVRLTVVRAGDDREVEVSLWPQDGAEFPHPIRQQSQSAPGGDSQRLAQRLAIARRRSRHNRKLFLHGP